MESAKQANHCIDEWPREDKLLLPPLAVDSLDFSAS